MTALCGYGEMRVEDALHDLAVANVVIPARANPASPDKEHRKAFRNTSSGAPGSKEEVSTLKRGC